MHIYREVKATDHNYTRDNSSKKTNVIDKSCDTDDMKKVRKLFK